MITYTAGYKIDPDGVHSEVFDFPGVLTCGSDLAEAREMLADALVGMAEINLEMGEPLPKPDPSLVQDGFDIVEPIRLVVSVTPELARGGAAAVAHLKRQVDDGVEQMRRGEVSDADPLALLDEVEREFV